MNRSMTFRRLASVVTLLLVVVLLAPLAAHPTSVAAVGSYNNAAIADYALALVGQWGGQCRQFVNNVVSAVSGGTQSIGGGNGAFPNLAANGIEITDINALVKGDVVQFENSPQFAWLHTFIIVSRVSGNTFNVVDSNWDVGSGNNEIIHAHQINFTLDPATRRAFRFGAVGSSTPPNQPPNKPSLASPADGTALGSSTSVTLAWSDNGDPDNKPNAYRDYYTELYLNGTLINQQNWSTPTSWTISNLSAGNYEWRVQSGDGVASSAWTEPWHFTVGNVPLEIACDDQMACFSKYESSGAWGNSSDATTYRQHSYWTYNSQNTALDWGKWQPSLPLAGKYDVYVWYPQVTDAIPATGAAAYQVHDTTGDRNVSWNQATNPGAWNKIATVSCAAGTACYVQLTDSSPESTGSHRIWLDAVKFVQVLAPAPQIILSPLQLTRGTQMSENGSGFTPNGQLHMSILLPDGTYYEQALQADANGSFANPYTVPTTAGIGHYAYRIQDLTTGIWSNTVEYDVLASTPPVTPTTATRTATTATAIPPTATTMTPTPTAATLTPTPTASATTGSVLALVPAATTLSVGGTLAVAVEVRSGTQPIDGAAVYLDFDPAVLEVVSVIPSASLPISLTQKSDPIGGHLDLIRGAISSLPQGTFSLATVTFRARIAAPTGTSLSISRTTARPSDVSFGGISKLGQTIPATLTIRDGSMITVDVPFEGRPQAPSVRLSVPLSVTLTLAGATTPAYQAMLTTDQYGRFPLVGIVPGTYTLSVKHPQSLRVQITAVITSGTATLSLGLLPSGDANNDNQINLLDFSLLSGTFGKSSSTTGYDSRADFNNDNIINLLDFSLLAKNFGKAGLASSPLALTTVNTPQVVAQVVRDLRAGETFALDLAVNAPMTGIDGAAAYLNFDPTLLEVATITGDPTLDLSLQQEIDNPNGQVALVRGTLTSPLPTGRVNLGRITFRARTQATAAVITLVDDGGLRQSAVTANGRTLAQTDAPWQLTATTAGYSVYLPLVVR
ncbi:MAG: dockerin type I domain-containing protein [Chloroflexales bacterium]